AFRRAIRGCRAVPESLFTADGAGRLSPSAPLARGMHVRTAEHLSFGRPEDTRHTVPARWQAGMRRMRLYGLGGHARGGGPEARWADPALGGLEYFDPLGRARGADGFFGGAG